MLWAGKHWKARNLRETPHWERCPPWVSATSAAGTAFLGKIACYDVTMSPAKPGHDEHKIYR